MPRLDVKLPAALALQVALALALPAAPALARGHPVVVELFTSQGCSACLSADTLPAALDGDPTAEHRGVLALTFPVGYWDYLGWRDTFAQPAFAERQRAYAKAFGEREVFTPQVVVDGEAEAGKLEPGRSLADATDGLIRQAGKASAEGPRVAFLPRGRAEVGVGRPPHGGAEVWLVRYEADPAEVPVTAGDNRGQAVRYHNVVRELHRLGAWTGRPRAYVLPQASQGKLKSVVLVQADSGRILSAEVAPDGR